MKISCKLLAASALMLVTSVVGAQAQELKGVGISVNNLGDPFYVAVAKGAEEAVKKAFPDAEVMTTSADFDIVKQVNQIDNFISAGVGLIVLTVADDKAIAPALARAKAQGIVVVGADNLADGLDATVATDSVAAGRLSCEELAKRLGGKGKVAIISGPPLPNAVNREKGCTEELAKYPEIEFLGTDNNGGFTRDGGMKVMQGLLNRFERVDGAFVVAEDMAVGAQLAAVQAGLKDIKFSSVDGSPAVTEVMSKEGSLIVATAAQSPFEIGREAAALGVEIVQGNKPADPFRKLLPNLVTVDTIHDYKGW
ncbi:substrate-binding domain-containing protein [Rhizobium sp. Root1204]|uniref:substrate-binding domain-containing protein n=1 Tax=Rhizobium sp. Root1204 TaxID=1736428 RepID=UPI00071397EB|nr:substrate-binding domain-containing protein [Rhizobium sp. Root1204]KQV41351.1 hypothetical protein ASC96_18850 [Rhizobium sp. Root1204]